MCLTLFPYPSSSNMRTVKTHVDYIPPVESLSTDTPCRGVAPFALLPSLRMHLRVQHAVLVSKTFSQWEHQQEVGHGAHLPPCLDAAQDWVAWCFRGGVWRRQPQEWAFSLGKCTRGTWTTHYLLQTNCNIISWMSSKIKLVFFKNIQESA